MRQIWIQKNGLPILRIFFAGWGMDEKLCGKFESDRHDLLFCCDYRDLTFDSQLLSDYKEIEIAAWSLGVWAASVVMHEEAVAPSVSIAFNGTPVPIHDSLGIPCAVYEGTLNNLSAESLLKFNRRMCGSNSELQLFEQHRSSRSVESLKEELSNIRKMYDNRPSLPEKAHWDEAWIGEKDRIFPVSNQYNAWEEPTHVRTFPAAAHYNKQLIDRLIGHPNY